MSGSDNKTSVALRVFAHRDGELWVASSPEHTAELVKKACGDAEGYEPDSWKALSDGYSLEITDEETGKKEKKTAAEWAAECVPGYFAGEP